MKANQFTPAEDRFWSNVVMVPEAGCWIWTGSAPKTKGGERPRMRFNGGQIAVYRWAYQHFIGPIPRGLLMCDVPLCVNPYHLFAGTHKDNYHDADRKGTLNAQASSGT